MSLPLPYCVYVLQSVQDRGLYIGFTTDLTRRLEEHNSGQSPSTAPRRPFELVFCECYRAKGDAVRRETYLKTAAGRRTLKLMLQESLPTPSDNAIEDGPQIRPTPVLANR
jgi:putative endonuclease